MSAADQFFWAALGAAALWLLMLLACVVWFALSVWIEADEAPDTHVGLADDGRAQ